MGIYEEIMQEFEGKEFDIDEFDAAVDRKLDEIYGDHTDIPPIEEVGFTPEEMKIATLTGIAARMVVFTASAKTLADSLNAHHYAHAKTEDDKDVFVFVFKKNVKLKRAQCRAFSSLIGSSEQVTVTYLGGDDDLVQIALVIEPIDE